MHSAESARKLPVRGEGHMKHGFPIFYLDKQSFVTQKLRHLILSVCFTLLLLTNRKTASYAKM